MLFRELVLSSLWGKIHISVCFSYRYYYYLGHHSQTLQSWRLTTQIRWHLQYASTIELEYLQGVAGLQFGKVAQAAHVGENAANGEREREIIL